MSLYLGADPGSNGAICLIDDDANIKAVSLRKSGMYVAGFLNEHRDEIAWAVVERVWVRTGDFTNIGALLKSAGFIIGLLTANNIPFVEVPPQDWMGFLRCNTRGDKHVSKRRIEQLYPRFRWTLGNADAGCIAEYARRTHDRPGNERLGRSGLPSPQADVENSGAYVPAIPEEFKV